jgi:hypothetical protein
MTETQLESGQKTGEQVEPTPETSATDAQQSSIDVNAVVEALIAHPELATFVDTRAERQWQSGKDKRIGKQETRMDEFESRLERMNEWIGRGKSQEEAMLLMKMEDQLADPNASPSTQISPTGEAGTQAQETKADMEAFLNLVGLDANDAEVVIILREEQDKLAQIGKFTALAEQRRQVQTAPPKPAQQMPGVGGGSVESDTLEGITAQLQVEMAKPIKDMVKIKELGKKHEELLPHE